MIITKEEFVRIINRLKETRKLQDDVNQLFRNARDNIENDFCNGASLMISHESLVIELLNKVMDLPHDVLSGTELDWWAYEAEFGEHNPNVYIARPDGGEDCIVLDTSEKFYDYIMKAVDKNHKTMIL